MQKSSALGDFKDEVLGQIEGLGKIAKKQIISKSPPPQQDPVGEKPKPSKKILTQLSQATAQLAQVRLKKVREELEKQRLKTSETSKTSQVGGPEVPADKPKLQDDAVAATLRNAQSTGEIGKNIGG